MMNKLWATGFQNPMLWLNKRMQGTSFKAHVPNTCAQQTQWLENATVNAFAKIFYFLSYGHSTVDIYNAATIYMRGNYELRENIEQISKVMARLQLSSMTRPRVGSFLAG